MNLVIFDTEKIVIESEVDKKMVCASLFSKKLTYAALTAVFKSLESPIDCCRELVDPVFFLMEG